MTAEPQERGVCATLERCREAIARLPIDALGEGSAPATAPDGEAGLMTWPLRDELLDEINRALAALRDAAPSGPEPDPMHMLIEDNRRMRQAGNRLGQAALRVIETYDGTHRLALAVSEWAKAVADEGRRAPAAERTQGETELIAAILDEWRDSWLNSPAVVSPEAVADRLLAALRSQVAQPSGEDCTFEELMELPKRCDRCGLTYSSVYGFKHHDCAPRAPTREQVEALRKAPQPARIVYGLPAPGWNDAINAVLALYAAPTETDG